MPAVLVFDVIYTVQASDDLQSGPLTVTEVTGADATAIQAGLPALSSADWEYRTFRSPDPVAGDPQEFMRVETTETPSHTLFPFRPSPNALEPPVTSRFLRVFHFFASSAVALFGFRPV